MEEARESLKGMTLKELESFMKSMGEPAFRARQVAQWVYQKGVDSIEEMSNLSRELRAKLAAKANIPALKIRTKQVSNIDGTTKYLFLLEDGHGVESVLMKYDYGQTVCVSSQVGCRMGCNFCASTLGGLVRNLTAGEILDQVLAVQKDSGERVSRVVIMGSGEPLDNMDETLKFIHLITAEYSLNISTRHVTLSSCGLVPEIQALAREKLPITLAISLHAPRNDLRSTLMPINRKYPLEVLIPACRDYANTTKRRITFEYSLIGGVNDSTREARELAALIKGILCHVNLIPINPVKERGQSKPNPAALKAFHEVLTKAGIEATIRRELGTDIDAACGQLRRRVLETTTGV